MQITFTQAKPICIYIYRKVVICLWYLFKKCFEIGIVPSMWAGALIKPIPKSRDQDPCLPLTIGALAYYVRYLKFTHQF